MDVPYSIPGTGFMPEGGPADPNDPGFDLDGDGTVSQEEYDHFDNNQDGTVDGNDDYNYDGVVNPWEDHISRNDPVQDALKELAKYFQDPPPSPLVLTLMATELS